MNLKIFFAVITCCYLAFSLNTQAMEENEKDTKCRYFNGKPGSCRYGEKCNFSHVINDSKYRQKYMEENSDSSEEERLREESSSLGNSDSSEEERLREKSSSLGNSDSSEEERLREEEERLREEAASLGLSTYGNIASLKRSIRQKIREKKQQQYEERLRKEAASLGLSTYGDITSLKSSIREKKQQQYEERQKRYEAGQQQYEPRKIDRIIYENKQQERNRIYRSLGLDPVGRMVGDGRGGTFFAIWGKDDN